MAAPRDSEAVPTGSGSSSAGSSILKVSFSAFSISPSTVTSILRSTPSPRRRASFGERVFDEALEGAAQRTRAVAHREKPTTWRADGLEPEPEAVASSLVEAHTNRPVRAGEVRSIELVLQPLLEVAFSVPRIAAGRCSTRPKSSSSSEGTRGSSISPLARSLRFFRARAAVGMPSEELSTPSTAHVSGFGR